MIPDGFNREQVMVQKSLASGQDKIEEVDSSAEQSDIERLDRAKDGKKGENLRKQEVKELDVGPKIAKHVGSVEEYLSGRILFEQGQMKVSDYSFFVNVYFRDFNMDHVHDYKDLYKVMEFDVISKNPKLYVDKDFPSDFIQQLERSKKETTDFISYCEIELLSRDSLSHWRDTISISWEKLRAYFKFFNLKFNPIQFIRSQKFTKQERYLFFEYFSSCLEIENSQAELDLNMIDLKGIYDYCYLNQDTYGFHFFLYNQLFPEDYCYEDMEYDPYSDHMPIYMEAFDFSRPKTDDRDKARQMNLAFNLDEEKSKYKIKKNLKQYEGLFRNNNNLVKLMAENESDASNLTLKSLNSPSGIFLGRLKLGSNPNIFYNVRIDYYKRAKKPVLDIKICNRHCIYRVKDERQILRIIKLCNMSSSKFVKNQLKSLLTLSKKINGRFLDLMLNKGVKIHNTKKQEYLNLMLCNELLLRRNVPPVNQFQSIIMQESFGRVLACITEFKIETEMIQKFNQFSHMYGNKHLDEKTKAMLTEKSTGKYFRDIRYWKINMHVLSRAKQFNTMISYDDLQFFYETQIFDFFENNPNIPMPNLVELLSDYLKNIFVYRTLLGKQVFWRFPIYRKPLEMGDQPVVSNNQLKLNKIYEMISFYKKLQFKIDEYNDHVIKEENIPLSLNRERKKKIK